MKCLVYCILRDEELPDEVLPVGIDGNKVSLTSDDGLAAAFSAIDDACDPFFSTGGASVSRATAYASVIEALHRKCTVLPLRMGCLLPSEERVTALLRERREEFLASLDEVQGCVEMVLHLQGTQPSQECLRRAGNPPLRAASPSDPGRSPGIAHMVALRRRYEQVDAAMLSAQAVAEECRAAFEGLFVKWKAEYSRGGGHSCLPSVDDRPEYLSPVTMLRLFFLVKRERQQSFVGVYQDLVRKGDAPLCGRPTTLPDDRSLRGASPFLSGPWPPHNFVQCEHHGIASTLREQLPWK